MVYHDDHDVSLGLPHAWAVFFYGLCIYLITAWLPHDSFFVICLRSKLLNFPERFVSWTDNVWWNQATLGPLLMLWIGTLWKVVSCLRVSFEAQWVALVLTGPCSPSHPRQNVIMRCWAPCSITRHLQGLVLQGRSHFGRILPGVELKTRGNNMK